MSESWDQQLLTFLKRAGEDLKKSGEDLRGEAQRLLDEVRDPESQEALRARLRHVGEWARNAAREAGGRVEGALRDAGLTSEPRKAPRSKGPRTGSGATRSSPKARTPGRKTVGRKPGARGSTTPGAPHKKPLGRRRG